MNPASPSFPEGEQAIIGGCILDNRCIPSVTEILDLDDFYHHENRMLFSAIRDLYQANKPVDFITIPEFLRKNGGLEAAGGISAILDLTDSVPSAANISHYVEAVREKTLLRKTITSCNEIMNLCKAETTDTKTVLQEFQKAAFSLTLEKQRSKGLTHINSVLMDTIDTIEHAADRGDINTGLINIDRIIRGFRPSDLIIIGGRPSMGKTALAIDIACAAIKHVPIAFFSLEMSNQQVASRLLSKRSQVNLHHIRAGTISSWEWERIIHAAGVLSEFPLFLNDSASLTISQIKSHIRHITVKTGLEIGPIIVDYLQLMKPEGKFTSENAAIGSITKGLKNIAKEFNAPVICLSQLNRDLERRPFEKHQRRPRASDFRDSGSIEADADILIGLYRPEVYSEAEEYKGRAEAVVIKHRNGPIGIAKLEWHAETATFRNPALEGMDESNYQEAV